MTWTRAVLLTCFVAGIDIPVSEDPKSEIATDGRYDFVVSIPDIHGDLDVLLRALWIAAVEVDGLIDTPDFDVFRLSVAKQVEASDIAEELEDVKPLSNSRVLLVNTGDIVDRGPKSLSCYKAIWAAERVLGWTLINLIGNHEVMTIAGQADLYAHPDDISEFGGIKARRAQFGRGGKLWKKITDDFRFMLRVSVGTNDSTLFVHAGIDPAWLNVMTKKGFTSVLQMNTFLTAELKRNPLSEFISAVDSPVWTRHLAEDPDASVCQSSLSKVLAFFNVNRIVVGHTPQKSLRTMARCNGQLLLADVAMSRWMGSGKFGNPSAMIFVLSDAGSVLQRTYNVYWNHHEQKTNSQVLFEKDKADSYFEL